MRKRRKRELERADWARRVMANPKRLALVEAIAFKLWARSGGRRPGMLKVVLLAYLADVLAYKILGRPISGGGWVTGRLGPIPAWPEKEGS